MGGDNLSILVSYALKVQSIDFNLSSVRCLLIKNTERLQDFVSCIHTDWDLL